MTFTFPPTSWTRELNERLPQLAGYTCDPDDGSVTIRRSVAGRWAADVCVTVDPAVTSPEDAAATYRQVAANAFDLLRRRALVDAIDELQSLTPADLAREIGDDYPDLADAIRDADWPAAIAAIRASDVHIEGDPAYGIAAWCVDGGGVQAWIGVPGVDPDGDADWISYDYAAGTVDLTDVSPPPPSPAPT